MSSCVRMWECGGSLWYSFEAVLHSLDDRREEWRSVIHAAAVRHALSRFR